MGAVVVALPVTVGRDFFFLAQGEVELLGRFAAGDLELAARGGLRGFRLLLVFTF